MDDKFSQENIEQNCPHCDPNSFALKHSLKTTENFWIVCDVHPLTEGHILIIPRQHLSCIAEYSQAVYEEFLKLYEEFSTFVKNTYGKVSTFEHGKIGQTVFHSHVHILPFDGKSTSIVPEGEKYLQQISSINDLKDIFAKDNAYLFFSSAENMWTVDVSLGAPRFFRDRFAKALGSTEKGNWKTMHEDKILMIQAEKYITSTEEKWKEYNK